MPPAVPLLNLFAVNEAQVGFVHESGGLECQARLLVHQALRGQLAQFVVDKRQELLGGLRLASFDCTQNERDFGHSLTSSTSSVALFWLGRFCLWQEDRGWLH
jgi:hypothetical protein